MPRNIQKNLTFSLESPPFIGLLKHQSSVSGVGAGAFPHFDQFVSRKQLKSVYVFLKCCQLYAMINSSACSVFECFGIFRIC